MNLELLNSNINTLACIGAIVLLIGELFAVKYMRSLILVLIISAIAEVGYVLMGLGIGTFEGSVGSILHIQYQVVVRILVLLTAYIFIYNVGSDSLKKLSGIGLKMPIVGTIFAFGIFSIMGLSPFKSSISKFLIIYSAIESGNYLFAIAGIIGSILEAVYFLYIIQKICFEKNDIKFEKRIDFNLKTPFLSLSIILLSALTIIMGLYPETFIHFTEHFVANELLNLQKEKFLPEFETPWEMLVLVPYIGAFLVYFLGKVSIGLRNVAAVLISAASFYLVIDNTSLNEFSKLFVLIMSGICFLITVYSIGYFKSKTYANRYFFFLLLMQGVLIGVTSSKSFSSLYLFWELMTWTSYILVIHEQSQNALKAGFKYFLMCTSGAFVMLLGILTLHAKLGTFEINLISQNIHLLTPSTAFAILITFIIGFGVKAGLVPMHSWLPDAHPVAPSSISAPMSGILTKTGIYGFILVIFSVFGIDYISSLGEMQGFTTIGLVISTLGVLTLFYGEIMALRQKDIKRMLAYSTMAQIGEIVVTLGVGTYLSVVGSLYHVLNHSIMKNLLFLAVGALIYRLKTQDIEKFKGIGKQMPITSLFFSIGILAIMGLPPFNGFISKFLMLYANVQAGHIELAIFILLGSVIGVFYYSKLIRIIFFEKYEGEPLKEAPLMMLIPLGILTTLIIINGFYPQFSMQYLIQPVADFVFSRNSALITQIPNLSIAWNPIVLIPMFGAIVAFIFGKNSPKIAGIASILALVLTILAIVFAKGEYNTFSWCFAFLIAFVALLNIIYNVGYMDHHGHAENRFYMFFLLMIGGLLGVSISKDLFNFFFFWEIMSSWTLYFVIIHEQTQKALKEGFKYFIFNYIGASFMFLGVIIIMAFTKETSIGKIAQILNVLDINIAFYGLGLLIIGLMMKAAMLPFRIDYQMHPEAAPTPVSGYISAVLLKSAPFGLVKLFFVFGGIAILSKIDISFNMPTLMYICACVGAITIIFAACMALLQDSIKLVLIYSTVSQLGYIVLGLSLGTSLGVSGGLLHLVNHMFFKDLLFLVAGVLMVKAGVKKLSQLGGLGKKMPLTLLAFSIGALSTAGIPPFSGFTSKWIIYQAAMQEGHVFLALASLVASVITLAYLMKFLHAAFFGQLPSRLEQTKEAPLTMLIPMMILSFLCIFFGVFPGLLLEIISEILVFLSLEPIPVNVFGIASSYGVWNAGFISLLLVVALLLGICVYLIGNRNIRFTGIYTCGIKDLKPEEIHVDSNALYQTPISFIKSSISGVKKLVTLGQKV